MNFSTLKKDLRQHPELNVRFIFPDGDPIEAEFHVTEVGHVRKNFVDCGGTLRSTDTCLLQTWVSAQDPDHRLSAGKLANILDLSQRVLPSEDLDVEVEYEACAVSQYTVDSASVAEGELRFTLGNKHTDCLARELCGIGESAGGCGCGDAASGCC